MIFLPCTSDCLDGMVLKWILPANPTGSLCRKVYSGPIPDILNRYGDHWRYHERTGKAELKNERFAREKVWGKKIETKTKKKKRVFALVAPVWGQVFIVCFSFAGFHTDEEERPEKDQNPWLTHSLFAVFWFRLIETYDLFVKQLSMNNFCEHHPGKFSVRLPFSPFYAIIYYYFIQHIVYLLSVRTT